MHDFSGYSIVVTGAAGHLGRATASAFAAAGASVALIGRRPEPLAAVAADIARALPPNAGQVAAFPLDLLDPDAVAATIAAVVARFGGLRVLVNVAGGFTMGPPLHETGDADWNLMFDLNARTLFHGARAAIPHLADGGAIVNVAALAALHGAARMGPYAAAKAAVVSLTRTLADELKPRGINVNAVLPGIIDTPPNRAAMPDQDPAAWVTPEALARVILFLASADARPITGAAIPVQGGG